MDVLLCIADHYEPFRRVIAPDGSIEGGRSIAEAKQIVGEWCEGYSKSVDGIADSDGFPPRHTFFYPQDEYDRECVGMLAELCGEGLGEIEIQIHHRNDTAGGLRGKLSEYRDVLRTEHGALGSDRDGNPRYGFVHGNWCLCNSRPDGDWCGVNEELSVLVESGCYADFTFPSAPSATQPRTVNTIYRASDVAGRARGHDRGERLRAKENDSNGRDLHAGPTKSRDSRAGSGLVMIPGPLSLNWRRRKWGVLPRLDNGEVSGANPPAPERADLWVKQHIHVAGRPEWVFVKLHTHGCIGDNAGMLFGPEARRMHEHFRGMADCRLHYVTARELFNIARAAEDGNAGNAADFRDYEIGRPRFRR